MNIKRKIILLVILIFLLLSKSTIVYGVEMKCGEYSTEYEKWLKLSDEEKENTIAPLPFNIEYNGSGDSNDNIIDKLVNRIYGAFQRNKSEEIPNKFDLRDMIDIEVKNQLKASQCWAFAANSALETYSSLNNKNYNFSERHIDYDTSSSFIEGPKEDSLNRDVRDGGLVGTAFTYYSRGSGPVLEEDMPFKNHENLISQDELTKDRTIQKVDDMIYFPQIYKNSAGQCMDANENKYDTETVEEMRDTIKKHIMNYGGVITSIYSPNNINYYNVNTFAAYVWNNMAYPNHDVLIIGWDDNFSKDNFLTAPKNDGAYIVLNSYGSEFGENGIYYVSYEDCWIEANIRGITRMSDVQYDNIYQHDISEMYNCIDSKYAANVFTAQKNEILTEVMIGSTSKQFCNLYINNMSDDLNVNHLNMIESNVELNPGYNTIKINTNIELFEGNKFAIVVELVDNYFGLGIEDNTSSFANVKSNAGESFISSNGVNWEDIYDPNNAMNFSIKAFTKTNEKTGKITNVKYSNKNIIEGIIGNATIYLKTTTALEGVLPKISIFNNNGDEVTSEFNILEIPYVIGTLSKIKIEIPAQIQTGKYTLKVYDETNEIDECELIVFSKDIIDDQYIDIYFPDKNLYEALKERNVLQDNQVLAYFDDTQEMILKKDITGLDFEGTFIMQNGYVRFGSGYNINCLEGLGKLQNLRNLNLSSNYISDLSPISSLTNLEQLQLYSNVGSIDTLQDLKNLHKLHRLEITNSGVKDVSALKNLSNLRLLDLQSNDVSDISALNGLENLTYLCLDNCNISDISDLKNLVNLTSLFLQGNQITDISSLEGLVKLNKLYIDNNQITDISCLHNLTNLEELLIYVNNITDISALEGCKSLRYLDCNYNHISDVSVIKDLKNIKQMNFSWQDIVQTYYKNDSSIVVPEIIQEALDKNSIFCSESGLQLYNCSWIEEGKRIKIDDENSECWIKILEGVARETIVNIIIDNTDIDTNNFIKIKETYENRAVINDNNLFVKLDGQNTNIFSFCKPLHINNDWTNMEIYTDTAEEGKFTISHDEIIEYGENYLEKFFLGNAFKLIIYKGNESDCYNIYQMGNVYVEDSNSSVAININDVIYFRKAIVGIKDVFEDSHFHAEATDVNFSNENIGTLGDVGDIIEIRERILNGYWK